jgi:hypothetical protein
MHEGYFQALAKQFSTDIPETYAGLAWRSTIATAFPMKSMRPRFLHLSPR